MNDVSNYDDTIDTRDAQATIDRLFPWKFENETGEIQDEYATQEDAEEFEREHPDDVVGWYLIEYDDESQLRDQLLRLRDQVNGPEWDSGATLIRDSYFEEYARQYAEDIFSSELRDSQWPFNHIAWDDAADELRIDYTSVDFAGETYWYR